MSTHDRAIAQFRRRLAGYQTLRHSLHFLAAWAFVWGTLVLAVRVGVGASPLALLLGLVGLPLAVAAAAWLAVRALPSRPAVRALLDRHNDCGGLLMAGEDHDLGAWQGRVATLHQPRFRWSLGRSSVLLAAAAAFLLASFLVPQRYVDFTPEQALDVRREAARLDEQIAVLREEKLLDPERADTLQEKLSQVREKASGQNPARTLEALDHLGDVTKQAAEAGVDKLSKKKRQMEQVKAAAQALAKAKPRIEPKDLSRAMAELTALAQQAAAENDLLQGQLDPDLQDALDQAGFDPDQLNQLADSFSQGQKDIDKRLKKLHRSRLIDARDLQRCDCEGECDSEALAKYLCEKAGKCGLKDALAQCEGAGRGGTTEGPGHAQLALNHDTKDEEHELKPEALPPAALAELKKSKLLGLGLTAPKVETGGAAAAGALQDAAAGGGSANTQVVLPRHRGTVARYFDRPEKK